MKFNLYQKIILVLYSLFFIYFSIIHVPFKIDDGSEIKYDTLLSNSSNLDVSRLVLIIVILSILTAILFLLFRNINYSINFKQLPKRTIKTIFFIAIGLAIILAVIFGISKYQSNKKDIVILPTVDSTSVTVGSTVDSSTTSEIELKRAENCTGENALINFQSYMKFYYPDWKIYGKPVVMEQSDCKYEIQFTTMNPHYKYFREKEIMIVQISFNYDYSSYYFETVRGTLY